MGHWTAPHPTKRETWTKSTEFCHHLSIKLIHIRFVKSKTKAEWKHTPERSHTSDKLTRVAKNCNLAREFKMTLKQTCSVIRSPCSLDQKQFGWIIKTPNSHCCFNSQSTHKQHKMFYIISLNVKYLPFHLVKLFLCFLFGKTFPFVWWDRRGCAHHKLMRCAWWFNFIVYIIFSWFIKFLGRGILLHPVMLIGRKITFSFPKLKA